MLVVCRRLLLDPYSACIRLKVNVVNLCNIHNKQKKAWRRLVLYAAQHSLKVEHANVHRLHEEYAHARPCLCVATIQTLDVAGYRRE